MKPIRIGIVGAGQNTRARHIPGLLEQPDVTITRVCNRTRPSAERVAEEWKIASIDDHWTSLVEAEDVDAVVIGTWPYLHEPVTCAALKAGKHVMTEARMARNAAEARAMLQASGRRPDLVTQVVPSPFSLQVDSTVCRLLAEGYLGDVLAVEHRGAGGFLPPHPPAWHWRKDQDLSGYNIMGLGIVYEMIMRWIGPAHSVQAAGKVVQPFLVRESGERVAHRIPQHLDVTAEMVCGAQLHLQQSQITAHLDGTGTWLFGTDGVLHFDQGKLFGATRDDEQMTEIPIPEHERTGWRVEEEFIQAIRGQEQIQRTRFEDGVRYMEFTEAVWTSMREGRRIFLP